MSTWSRESWPARGGSCASATACAPISSSTSPPPPGATRGDGNPLILRGGRAVASWSHRFAANQLIVGVKPFGHAALSDDIFDAVGQLLSASSVEVTRQDQAAAAT